MRSCASGEEVVFSSFLLQNLNENQDGQNDAHQSIQADQGTQQAEDDTDQRDRSQQADDDAADDINDHINDQGDDESGQFGCLEGVGEEFLEHIHIYFSSLCRFDPERGPIVYII